MSRKYRQRGYQDGADSRERRPAPPTRARRDGPRGRGLGAPTESAFKCARCGERAVGEVESDATCAKCGSDLHTCTNCAAFDTGAPNECREEVPHRIGAKARRNDCALFAAKLVKGFRAETTDDPEDARSAFDALFDL